MKKIRSAICIILCLFFTFSITGCSNNQDIYKLIKSQWTTSGTYNDDNFMKTFDDYSSFKIIDVQKEKDCSIVTCEVSSPNILDKLKEYQKSITEIPSDSEINEKIKEFIATSEIKTTKQTVNIFLTDNGNVVQFSEGFIDAMYGYSYTYSREQTNKMMNNIK